VIPAAALAQGVSLRDCPIEGRLVVGSGGVGAHIPSPGDSVLAGGVAAIDQPSGQLVLTTDANGTVTAADGLLQAGSTSTCTQYCDPCAYRAYDTEFAHESDNHTWRFNSSTTPARNSITNARDAIVTAATNLVNGYNNCNLNYPIGASHNYAGDTTQRANIANDATCASTFPDGYNRVNFGTLTTFIAVTCTAWHNNGLAIGEIYEADIKIADGTLWDANGGVCATGEYDLQTVLTHEWGHAYGLLHVDETTNRYATMSPKVATCSTRERTLGYGDWLGLDSIYP